ncbi:DUF4232 domain-containing protein [Actinokineospora inagensis]|uniref:DUF4232 domain-containing protein n=1 Tax=Actinokineospora inagensis TaxID=103730 RepID=UPI000410F986|nr:DUF4232 domain-containing protein [Actinokineospora inagensis]
MWGTLFSALALTAGLAHPAPAPLDQNGSVPTCSADHLAGEIRDVDPGAGQRYATLRVRNTGTKPCTLNGYGTLRLINAAGRPNPTRTTHIPPTPARVVLAPGAAADKTIHWTVIPGEGEPDQCQPPSAGLLVTPPGSDRAVTVRFEFGPVCQGGLIDHSAYFPAAD